VPLIASDVLSCAVSAVPGRLAVTLGDAQLTFAEVEAAANRYAHVLIALGARSGGRVAWWSEISLEAVSLFFAAARLGLAFAPLNPAYGDAEAAAVLDYLEPQFVIAGPQHAARAAGITQGAAPLLSVGIGAATHPGIDLDGAAAESSPSAPVTPLPDEGSICTIFLTSGSTGRPKGVMVSQRATWLRTHAGAAAYATTGGRGELVTFPLFHMAGWNFAMMAWSAGHAAHLVHRADGSGLLDVVARWSPAIMYCIPAVWRRVLDERGAVDTTCVEWALTGTSQVTTELLAGIGERFPRARTTVNYGSTETARAAALRHEDRFTHPGSVGHAIPGVRAALADDGELLIASDRLMAGYLSLPDETALALDGGWYHTGDLADCDDDGYLYIVGRKKEVIRSGGETVAPVEVEAALAGYPGVHELAVVGVPDPDWGEVVCAAVVVPEGQVLPSVDDLRRHIGDRLAPFKHPRRVVRVQAIPRTPATGQVQRARLVDQLDEGS
jgi:acyl-CoA synthetase (AMP-forming)/AMP-acid ligase II